MEDTRPRRPLDPEPVKRISLLFLCLLAACSPQEKAPSEKVPLKAAVIGGMVMTGLWDEVARAFEAETGIPVVAAATGPKDILNAKFRKGGINLITLHSSDVATNLVADGLAVNMRPWARNEQVIVGPPEDPAKIRGLASGAEAFKRIAAIQAPLVEARGTGSKIVCERLWHLADIEPVGPWILRDESPTSQQVLEFAAQRRAYVVVGRIPVLHGKMPAAGLEILVQGDPEMRRPFVVLEAAHSKNARLLSDFLVSEKAQKILANFAGRHAGEKISSSPQLPNPNQTIRPKTA